MIGTYRIITADSTKEFRNVITTDGKNRILDAVSGKVTGFASSMVAGVGSTAASSGDKTMEFMAGGADVNAIITDSGSGFIYFKSTLPANDDYEIYELGCYSINYNGVQNATQGSSLLLAVFGDQSDWVDDVGSFTLASTNNRIGPLSIQYSALTNVQGSMPLIKNFSELPSNTTFDLAYYTSGLTDLTVRFKVDASNYFEVDTWPVTNGYHISKIAKSSFTTTGTPTWADIQVLEVEANGTAGVLSLDALRYTPPVINNTDVGSLLSRVVLITPERKLPGVSMDIEYKLELGI